MVQDIVYHNVKCKGLYVPQEDIGSDAEGIKPIIFDVCDNEWLIGKNTLEETISILDFQHTAFLCS